MDYLAFGISVVALFVSYRAYEAAEKSDLMSREANFSSKITRQLLQGLNEPIDTPHNHGA